MDASIIIPVYGSVGYLYRCLTSLETHTGPHELILVDNGTQHPLPPLSCAPKVIRNPQNTGFAHACNQGAAIATTAVLVFLNVDTEVHRDWLPHLIQAFNKPDVAIAGSKLILPNGEIQHTGVVFGRKKDHFTAHERFADAEAGYVPAVTGACLAIRKEIFNAVGGFDEGFYNGYEDIDLCLKIREKGWRIWYEPSSIVTHIKHATGPSERFSKYHENIKRLNDKWFESPVSWMPP